MDKMKKDVSAMVNIRAFVEDAADHLDMANSYIYDNLDAMDELVSDTVKTAYRMRDEASELISEASETLEFLMRRNASPESITAAGVTIYHGRNMLKMAQSIIDAPNLTIEAGC